MTGIEELQQKMLEEENSFLKSLLDNAGISYTRNDPSTQQLAREPYDSNLPVTC